MKRNKGITLVALVITIIILIILAGISISILIGEDGIIAKAKQGVQNYQNSAIEEQDIINNLYDDFTGKVARTSESFVAQTRVSDEKAVTSDKMLKDYKAYVNGQLITGSMTINQNINENLNPGESFTIPEGYHDGTGMIIANTFTPECTYRISSDANIQQSSSTSLSQAVEPGLYLIMTVRPIVNSNGTVAYLGQDNAYFNCEISTNNGATINVIKSYFSSKAAWVNIESEDTITCTYTLTGENTSDYENYKSRACLWIFRIGEYTTGL